MKKMIGKIWRNSLNGKKELNKGLWEGSVNQDIFRVRGTWGQGKAEGSEQDGRLEGHFRQREQHG